MAFAVDIIDRCGPSNEIRCHLQPKKIKLVLCVLSMYITAKDVLPTLHCLQGGVL